MSVTVERVMPKSGDSKEILTEKLHIAIRRLEEVEDYYFKWITFTRALDDHIDSRIRESKEDN
jgi:hypothetical protein